MADRHNFVTPVGRLVAGSFFKENTTNMEGKPLERSEWFAALAFHKQDPQTQEFLNILKLAAKEQGRPELLDEYGMGKPGLFSMKVVDGDSTIPNMNQTRPCDKEGYPDHWVVSFKTGYAPKVFQAVGKVYRELQESDVKRGDYFQISGSTSANGNALKPGIYVNMSQALHVGHGEEIVSEAANPQAAFGSATPSTFTPPGMTAVGQAPATNQDFNQRPEILEAPKAPVLTDSGRAAFGSWEKIQAMNVSEENARRQGWVV